MISCLHRLFLFHTICDWIKIEVSQSESTNEERNILKFYIEKKKSQKRVSVHHDKLSPREKGNWYITSALYRKDSTAFFVSNGNSAIEFEPLFSTSPTKDLISFKVSISSVETCMGMKSQIHRTVKNPYHKDNLYHEPAFWRSMLPFIYCIDWPRHRLQSKI